MITTTDHWIDVAQGRLFARIWQPPNPAEAPPIILLHDSLGCVALWRDFPEALCAATGRRVIAYDRLGFGKSNPFPGRIPLDFIYNEYAASLQPVCAELGIDRFVLFGHSVGGPIGVVSAAKLPAQCVGLVTESAQIFREEITFEGIRAAKPVFAPGAPAYERLRSYHGDKTDWVLRSWQDTWLDPTFEFDLSTYIAALRCPVLAIHGDCDEYGSTEQPKYLCAMTPGPKQLLILENCGHVPHREQADKVLKAMAAFTQVA